VLTLPVSAHATHMLPADLVDTLLNTWIISWDADRLAHGLRGLWDAPIYYSYHDTLAFSENLLGLAFFVAPVRWISGNPVLTYNVAFLLSFVLAGTGMYLPVRELTGSWRAAAVAGACYAFCPYRMTQISHVQMVATGWIPVALWGLHRYLSTRRTRWLVVFAAGWIFQALSNSYVFYYIAVAIALVAAEGLMRERHARLRAAVALILASASVVVVLAPVGAAYYRVRASYGQKRSADEMVRGSADLRSYLVGKNSIGIWRWLPTAVGGGAEKELFPGVFTVLLAVFALAAARAPDEPLRRWVRLYGVIAVAAVLLSLGPEVRVWGQLVTAHGPYDWLVRAVPGMDGMRVPARFAIIFSFALAVLAGCGASVVLAWIGPNIRLPVLAICLAAVVADGWAAPLPSEPYERRGRPEDWLAARWLRSLPQGAVLHLPMTNVNFYELHYQYATLFHGHPLVNGFSGYNTRLQEFLRSETSPLVDFERFPAAVRMLRALGVRYLVIHPGDYVLHAQWSHEAARTIDGLRGSGQVVREQTLPPVSVFELQPWEDLSAPDERVVPIADRELTREDGRNEIAARCRVPCDIARVELQLSESWIAWHPRDLRVEVTNAAGESRTLYDGSPYPELAAAIVRDGRAPTLVILLPRNRASRISVREITPTGGSGSVDGLKLWRRD